ncbi:hypothetical protein HY572_04115 [Candidatus Micrarchaeota archaeon]|nr:hypothetical protein [Candidatus Micrarchaeota archaeon]
MDLSEWRIEFEPNWDHHFRKFDRNTQLKIIKKIDHMKQPLVGRGLHGSPYMVEEVGQYRIAFEQDEKTRTKTVHFVGNHKQYEAWYRSL